MYDDGHPLSLRAADDNLKISTRQMTEQQENLTLSMALAEDCDTATNHEHRARVEFALLTLNGEIARNAAMVANPNLFAPAITPQSSAWQPVPLDLRQQLCFPAFKTRLECHEGFESKRSGWELFKMYASRHPFSLRADNDRNTAPAGKLSVEQLEEGLLLALSEDCTKTQDADTRQRIEILTVVILSKRRAKQLAGIRETAPGKGCLSVMVPMVLLGGALCCGFVVLLWQAVRW